MNNQKTWAVMTSAAFFFLFHACGGSDDGGGEASCASLCKCKGTECVSDCELLKETSVYSDEFYSHLNECISGVDCADEDYLTLQESCILLYLESLPVSQCEQDMIEARCTIPCLGLSPAEQEDCRLFFTDTLFEARVFTATWCAEGVACLQTYDCSDPGGDPIVNCDSFGYYGYTFL